MRWYLNYVAKLINTVIIYNVCVRECMDRGINTVWGVSVSCFNAICRLKIGLKVTLKHETDTYYAVPISMSTPSYNII